MKIPLRLDWVSREAALFAVSRWHYSRSMPTDPVVKIGVWERDSFAGVILFSRGANKNIGKPYGLSQYQVCELTRVALRDHETPVSRMLSIAVKMLRKAFPDLLLIVSYADANEGHHGGIYQAAGWIYVGETVAQPKMIDKYGKRWHSRQIRGERGYEVQYGTARRTMKKSELTIVDQVGKHKYLFPLGEDIRARLASLAKPYPKRDKSCGEGETDNALESNRETEGASPISPLSGK